MQASHISTTSTVVRSACVDHDVPAGPVHRDRGAVGAGVAWVRFPETSRPAPAH